MSISRLYFSIRLRCHFDHYDGRACKRQNHPLIRIISTNPFGAFIVFGRNEFLIFRHVFVAIVHRPSYTLKQSKLHSLIEYFYDHQPAHALTFPPLCRSPLKSFETSEL